MRYNDLTTMEAFNLQLEIIGLFVGENNGYYAITDIISYNDKLMDWIVENENKGCKVCYGRETKCRIPEEEEFELLFNARLNGTKESFINRERERVSRVMANSGIEDINDIFPILDEWVVFLSKKSIEKKNNANERTFSSLFKPDFAIGTKQAELKSTLERNGYTIKGQWRILGDREQNEPAKIYLFLRDKGNVFNDHPKDTGLRCFCKEFEINAYSDKDPKPTNRPVTLKNLGAAKVSANDKSKFEQIFNRFLSVK